MKLFLCIACFISLCSYIYADETWEFIHGIQESDLKHVAMDPYKKGTIYASGDNVLYRSEDNGNTWVAVFLTRREDSQINYINISKEGVFVCTQDGLYRSKDGKTDWKEIFKGVGQGENNVQHIIFSNNTKIFIGAQSGLFISEDEGISWKKDIQEAGSLNIKWIEILNSEIFLATEKGVYKNSDTGWKRVFITGVEDTAYDAAISDQALKSIKPVNSITGYDGNILLATDAGIFISQDKGGTWNEFISTGLISLKVKRLIYQNNLYAATDKGIFVFFEKEKLWKGLYKGMPTKDVRDIAIAIDGYVWAATKKGLYKVKLENVFFSDIDTVDSEKDYILSKFDSEPHIMDVQKAAIEYAEVHPDKIKEWREAASRKALFPNVSVGLDRYVTDYWHWDAGANPDVLQKGKDTVSWDITMTWDMGELIWNSDQTTIDTRSKLMVELRDDIMDQATRTYFERRRLQVELSISPPKDLKTKLEKELRLQELTADLDALTGGYFSKDIR